MNNNNENMLPPQGSRNPRGRRGEGIVPARSPSSSGEGHNVVKIADVGISCEDELKLPFCESVTGSVSENSIYDESESTSNSVLNSNEYWRSAEFTVEELNAERLNLYDKVTKVSPNLKGKSREKCIMQGIDRFDEFAIGVICKLQDSQVENSKLKEENRKLRMRLEVLESEVAKVKKTVHIIERNSHVTNEEIQKRIRETAEEEIEVNSTLGVNCGGKEKSIMSILVNRIDKFLETFIDRVHPLIKAEVRNVCEETYVATQSYADKLATGNGVCANVSPRSDNCNSDSFIMCGGNKFSVSDMKSFPPLKRKNESDSNAIFLRKSNKADNVSTNNCSDIKKDFKSFRKKSNEDALVIRILDENKITYSTLLAEFKKSINLSTDVGIESLKIRKSSSGGIILVIISQDATVKVKLLMGCIRKIIDKYEGNVCITRPRKLMNIMLSGTSEYVSSEEIITGVINTVKCSQDDITYISRINYRSYGRWNLRIACPKAIGNMIINAGRIQVGWSWALAREVSPPLLRCFRCLRTGHTRASCKEKIDRSSRCYKCGKTDHRVLTCKNDTFRCPLCMDDNRNANHRLGSPECVSPSFAISGSGMVGIRDDGYSNSNSNLDDCVMDDTSGNCQKLASKGQ